MRITPSRLAVIAALTLASAAAAQDAKPGGPSTPQPVEAGRVVEGRLDRPEVRHPLRLRAGETVRITARGRGFDALMKLYGPTGTEPLATDDDSGGDLIAELVFTAQQAGVYQVGVSQSGAADTDPVRDQPYDLTVVPTATPAVSAPVAITPNGAQPIAVDTTRCGNGCRYTFHANAGDRLVAQTSDNGEVDPIITLMLGAEQIAENDDGGEGLNSRLVHRLDRTGTYTLVAKTVHNGGTYNLSIAARPFVAPPARPLAVGTPVSARLADDADTDDNGRRYQAYTLHGRAGQHLVLDMESTDIDSQLEAWGESVLGPTQLAMNDDIRSGNLNSHLVLSFARDGDVEIHAVSLNNAGAYTLRVSEQPAGH